MTANTLNLDALRAEIHHLESITAPAVAPAVDVAPPDNAREVAALLKRRDALQATLAARQASEAAALQDRIAALVAEAEQLSAEGAELVDVEYPPVAMALVSSILAPLAAKYARFAELEAELASLGEAERINGIRPPGAIPYYGFLQQTRHPLGSRVQLPQPGAGEPIWGAGADGSVRGHTF